MKLLAHLTWAAVAVLGALTLGGIALNHGEPINSIWLVVAAACTYLVGFRFYAKFLAARVMVLNDKRATPAERRSSFARQIWERRRARYGPSGRSDGVPF